MNRFAKLTAVTLLAALAAMPVFAARGTADFSRYVVIGDSYGAGTQNNSTNVNHQQWSYPAIIARQAGLKICEPNATATENCFAQPLISFPGIGPELQLTSVVPSPVITPAAGMGTPLMTTFARPYNNLSVPAATLAAALTLTGAEPPTQNEPTAVTFSRIILRGQGTQVDQALALHPTFMTIWLGGMDALSAVFAGTPAILTPTADFKTRYEAVLDKLIAGAPNAGMVVGNIPTKPLPYMLLVKPYIVNPATGQPVPGPDGKPIYYIADLGGGNFGQLPEGSFVLLSARAKLESGYGFPAVPPFNALPNAGKPLADADVITPAEYVAIATRVAEYNAIISSAAAARNIPVANIAGLFDRVYAGTSIGGFAIGASPVTGGFFSLDFFHLTDLGYMMFANEYIRTINANYHAGIPVAGIWQLWANNGAYFPDATQGAVKDASQLQFSEQALKDITAMWAQPTIRRFRAVGH
jgi:hypothetical protein